MDIIRNPKLMEQNLSLVIHRTLSIGVRVSDHIKVHHQFHTKFKQIQEILYLKEIFQNVHLRFLGVLDHL